MSEDEKEEGERMPWDPPPLALLSSRDLAKEHEKARVHGATVEGACWFEHGEGNNDPDSRVWQMEEAYAADRREARAQEAEEHAAITTTEPQTPEPK